MITQRTIFFLITLFLSPCFVTCSIPNKDEIQTIVDKTIDNPYTTIAAHRIFWALSDLSEKAQEKKERRLYWLIINKFTTDESTRINSQTATRKDFNTIVDSFTQHVADQKTADQARARNQKVSDIPTISCEEYQIINRSENSSTCGYYLGTGDQKLFVRFSKPVTETSLADVRIDPKVYSSDSDTD